MWQDLRYAVRALLARPTLTAVAISSLALGIGVNTAIFSFYEHMLLRPLPVVAPDQIVNVTATGPRPGGSSTGDSGGPEAVFSFALFRDLERMAPTPLTGIAAHNDFSANVAFRTRTGEAHGLLVSGAYFATLAIRPAVGRLLTPTDDRPGSEKVLVLSHRYWTLRFAADPTVVGESMIVNGVPMTVVGIAPEGFAGTTLTEVSDVFVPLATGTASGITPVPESSRDNHFLYVFGRLKPGVTRAAAAAALNVPFRAIRDADMELVRDPIPSRDRQAYASRQIVLEDGSRGRNRNRQQVQLILSLMLGVTGFVLLIACANVANLLLTRVTDRATEIAVRVSLGASRARIVRLLLVEAGLLGALGGLAAIGVARAVVVGMLTLFPGDNVTFLRFGLSWSVLLFAMAAGVGTACIFGLFPALHGASGQQRAEDLGTTRVSSSRRANRFRTSLATAQIALATALLAQAGLLIANLTALVKVDLGIRREGLITFRVAPGQSGYTPQRSSALFEQLHQELRALPGVVSVAASTVPLLSGNEWRNRLSVQGADVPDDRTTAYTANVGVDYFRTVGIPLIAGREFTATDAGPARPAAAGPTPPVDPAAALTVAIVNEAFVRQFNLGDDVIGRRMRRGRRPTDTAFNIEIVGVVRDAKYSELKGATPAQFFQPYRDTSVTSLNFYVRTSGEPSALLAAVPSVVGRVDATLPVADLRTMDDQVWDRSTPERLLATVSSWVAALAAILAAIGLYAVLSYTVARRRREFGIRLALGARPGNVRGMVVAHVARMAVVGMAIGGIMALVLGRLGASVLTGVSGAQPAILTGAVAVIAAVIGAAAIIPARRAAAVEPATALRTE